MPTLLENPSFIAIAERIARQGPTDDLLDEALEIRRHHLFREQVEQIKQCAQPPSRTTSAAHSGIDLLRTGIQTREEKRREIGSVFVQKSPRPAA